MNIEVISGSPRQHSKTLRVALHLQQWLSQNTSHEVGLINLQDWKLPHMESVFSSPAEAPAHLQPLVKRMFRADAFLLVTPEYNGSYSPALKNLLDHFPKQEHKTFGVVTASTGALGGMRAAQQLLLLVPALFGIASPHLLIVPQVEKKFDEAGHLTEETFAKSVQKFATEFLWLAERTCTAEQLA